MITMTEDAFAEAMRQAAKAERKVTERRDGKLGWNTANRFPGQEAVPKRRRHLQDKLRGMVAEKPGQSAAELADQLGKTRESVGWSLRALARRGEIEPAKRGREVIYQMPGDA